VGYALAPTQSLKSRGNPDHLLQFAWHRDYFVRNVPFVRRAEPWERTIVKSSIGFEVISKRRRGFPSETAVKRGERLVHYDKELVEKLGRNDLCPCGSGRCFQAMLP